jgi:hypothetical protein
VNGLSSVEMRFLTLKYLGKESDFEAKVIKKALERMGVKEVYVGKSEGNATRIAGFANWDSSEVTKKKEEIERNIPNLKVVQTEALIPT